MKKYKFILAGFLVLVLVGCGGYIEDDGAKYYEATNSLADMFPTPPPTTQPPPTEPPPIVVPDDFVPQTPWVEMELEPDPRRRISAAFEVSFAIDRYGVLWAWGNNFLGELGVGAGNHNRTTPTQVMENAVAVSSSSSVTLAIGEDGGLYQWGFVQGTVENVRQTPHRIEDGIVWANPHMLQSRAISTTGEAFVWRNPTPGATITSPMRYQIFNSYPIHQTVRNFPRISSHYGVLAFAEGGLRTYVIMHNNSLYYWGSFWGDDPYTLVHVLDNIAYVSACINHTLAIGLDGRLYAWGDNSHGQIGSGFDDWLENPTVIMQGVTDISVLGNRSAIIDSAGNLTVRGYGSNENNVLLENAVLVCISSHHGLAITYDGGLYAWGSNNAGQLGTGDTEPQSTPVRVLENMR